MKEMVPVLLGAFLAVICTAVRDPRLRAAAWVVLSVAFGVAATVLTGEWEIGPEFLLVDIPLVAISAVAVTYGLRRLARTSSSPLLRPYAPEHRS